MKKISIYIIMLITFFIINTRVYADTCCYATGDGKVLITYDTQQEKFTVDKRGNQNPWGTEPLINKTTYNAVIGENYEGTFEDSETNISIKNIDPTVCMKYIVYRTKSQWIGRSEGVFGFNDYDEAANFTKESQKINKISAWAMEQTNQEEYNNLSKGNNSSYNPNVNQNLGEGNTDCTIFGEKSNPDSLSYLLNEILDYPKYIVPVLLIGLGTLDFCKAVFASKEDDMKKAQSTFIKRCILGVTFYFIPVLLNIIFKLADIVWSGMYSTCGL